MAGNDPITFTKVPTLLRKEPSQSKLTSILKESSPPNADLPAPDLSPRDRRHNVDGEPMRSPREMGPRGVPLIQGLLGNRGVVNDQSGGKMDGLLAAKKDSPRGGGSVSPRGGGKADPVSPRTGNPNSPRGQPQTGSPPSRGAPSSPRDIPPSPRDRTGTGVPVVREPPPDEDHGKVPTIQGVSPSDGSSRRMAMPTPACTPASHQGAGPLALQLDPLAFQNVMHKAEEADIKNLTNPVTVAVAAAVLLSDAGQRTEPSSPSTSDSPNPSLDSDSAPQRSDSRRTPDLVTPANTPASAAVINLPSMAGMSPLGPSPLGGFAARNLGDPRAGSALLRPYAPTPANTPMSHSPSLGSHASLSSPPASLPSTPQGAVSMGRVMTHPDLREELRAAGALPEEYGTSSSSYGSTSPATRATVKVIGN